MNLSRVRPGQPLRIPADTFNAILEATVDQRTNGGRALAIDGPSVFEIDALLRASPVQDGDNKRWAYGWDAAIPDLDGDDWAWKEIAGTLNSDDQGDAFNVAEVGNGEGGDAQALPAGSVVRLRWIAGTDGRGRWCFGTTTGGGFPQPQEADLVFKSIDSDGVIVAVWGKLTFGN